MTAQTLDAIILLALGLVAGTAGGLVGLGGSIIVIPVLTLVLSTEQHLAQAIAMIVNVPVALVSTIQHRRAGALRKDVLGPFLPAAVVCIVLGVTLSNQISGVVLRQIFGAFLLYVVVLKVFRLYTAPKKRGPDTRAAPPARVALSGGLTGGAAGLLGIGGGPVAVPMLNRLCSLPLRESIAASSAAMCITAAVGATYKNATLSSLTDSTGAPLGLHVEQSLHTAAWIVPTALVGAMFGADLTHRLPIVWLRVAFALIAGTLGVAMIGAR